ncbi:hypothetical protein I3214_00145 [Streptomyces sp. RB110-2]|nr:hypothetical protein [Streptomyces sp. RB110-2]MBK0384587.1 hypothetical protein [Streptomyces sp. RB110-2]
MLAVAMTLRGAEGLGDLDGQVADAAGGRVDHDALAGPEAAGLLDRVVRGLGRAREQGRRGGVEVLRDLDEPVRAGDDVVGVGVPVDVADDAVADGEAGDALAERLDGARDVRPGAPGSPAWPPIGMPWRRWTSAKVTPMASARIRT